MPRLPTGRAIPPLLADKEARMNQPRYKIVFDGRLMPEASLERSRKT